MLPRLDRECYTAWALGGRRLATYGAAGRWQWRLWDHGRTQGLVIVSKDTDFRERSYVEGFPPKIIWLDSR